jgi:hypothetical protein
MSAFLIFETLNQFSIVPLSWNLIWMWFSLIVSTTKTNGTAHVNIAPWIFHVFQVRFLFLWQSLSSLCLIASSDVQTDHSAFFWQPKNGLYNSSNHWVSISYPFLQLDRIFVVLFTSWMLVSICLLKFTSVNSISNLTKMTLSIVFIKNEWWIDHTAARSQSHSVFLNLLIHQEEVILFCRLVITHGNTFHSAVSIIALVIREVLGCHNPRQKISAMCWWARIGKE